MPIWTDEQGKEEYGPLDAVSVSRMSVRIGVLLLTEDQSYPAGRSLSYCYLL